MKQSDIRARPHSKRILATSTSPIPAEAGGLPCQRRGLAHRGSEVDRRRRLDDPLPGASPAVSSVDFEVRTRDGVADDWPVDYARLEPYYAINARMMGVSGLPVTPRPADPAAAPARSAGRPARLLGKALNELGWHWWPSDSAIATRSTKVVRPASTPAPARRLPPGRQGQTDVTYWPAAHRRGVALRTGGRVREITVGADGMADGVIYYDAEGVERRQAEVVVLPATASARRGSCSNSASRHPRTASRTAAAWSART